MNFFYFLVLATYLSFHILVNASNAPDLRSLDDVPVLHFTLSRRGGLFSSKDPGQELANMTYLAEELRKVEARFNLTKREAKGNKLVRKVKENGFGGADGAKLMGEVGENGRWFARIRIGQPRQEIEMDLDMLVSDFYVITTSSSKGSRYDDFFSQSSIKSNSHPFPDCRNPTDEFSLPTINTVVPLSFAHCRPSHSSLGTLGASGSVLGLAPSEHLSQTKTGSLFNQLLDKGIIERPVFSIMLINGEEGVLSVGGTSAKAVELVTIQTEEELSRAGGLQRIGLSSEPTAAHTKRDIPSDQVKWERNWKWSRVQGAEGWWQILMQGVWVDGSKVLKNQPVVVDINTPFILAPPAAVRYFYSSISGSRALPEPFSNFYMFPCLNPPTVHFEFDGWTFPAMQGGKGEGWYGMPGGRFSLGRWKIGSGYCIGAVVETRMGLGDEDGGMGKRGRKGGLSMGTAELAGNGMRDVWVIGETFFRGVGGVFDFETQRVGFRSY